MEQHQSWIIRETIDGNKYYDVQICESLDEVDNWIENQQSREPREIMIVERVVAETVLAIQTIAAYVPTLDEIAHEIIEGSDGSYNVEWGEDYAALDFADRERVEAMVWEEIASCDGCGWHFHLEQLEQHFESGDSLCWRCHSDREEAKEEDDYED